MYSDFQKFPPKKHKRSKLEPKKKVSSAQGLTSGRLSLPPREPIPEPGARRRTGTDRNRTPGRVPGGAAGRAPGKKPSAKPRASAKRRTRPKSAAANRRPASFRRYRLRRLRWGRLVFVALLATAFGYGVYWLTGPGWTLLMGRLRGDISQATGANGPLPYTSGAYALLDQRIGAYLATQPGQYALAGQDLSTGASFGIGQSTGFSAAQTIALPVVIDLFNQMANGSLKATATVALTARDVAPGPGFIGAMPAGSRFSLDQLARAALVNSDATALNMLIRTLGQGQVNNFAAAMGGGPSALARPYRVTPLELTRYLAYLYTMDNAHPRALAPLMKDLAQVPSEGRLAAGFPKGTQIAHIVGDWPHEFHDAAIVWTIGHPLALAVCSAGVTQAAAAKVESHIAHMVAQFELTGE